MSAVAFGLSFLVLVSVATLSIISVVSYLLLACLCVTITFRVYKAVIQAVQKSDDGHPFRSLLERDISVSSESVRLLTDQSLIHLNWFISQSRRLLLVQDLVDSLKLAAVMWLMTYIGSVFNGVTIMILGETGSLWFSLYDAVADSGSDEFKGSEFQQQKFATVVFRQHLDNVQIL
uniref:Reticulon n=1 Tax=Scophthalmus maximus TaxID=52904 RepID=A0A8D3DT87_SCOMX